MFYVHGCLQSGPCACICQAIAALSGRDRVTGWIPGSRKFRFGPREPLRFRPPKKA